MFLPFGKLPHGQVNASCNLVTLAKECLWTQNHKVGFAPQCSPHIQDILWAHFLEALSKTPRPMFLEVRPFHQNHSCEIMPKIFPQVPKASLKTVFCINRKQPYTHVQNNAAVKIIHAKHCQFLQNRPWEH